MIASVHTSPAYQWGAGGEGWRLFQSPGLAVIEEKMSPGCTENWHYHQQSQQVFYVLEGSLLFEIEQESWTIGERESMSIAAGQLHRVSNKTSSSSAFLLISSPSTQNDRIDIVDFTNSEANAFKELNYEWLEKYFWIEKRDQDVLSNPGPWILDKGGCIFYAKENATILGTVALLPEGKGTFELTKMAVTATSQGKGIGKQLLKHAIKAARERKATELFLYSNRKLESAIHLYRTFGFEEILVDNASYARADIKMYLPGI